MRIALLTYVVVAALRVAAIGEETPGVVPDGIDRLLDAIAKVESRHNPSAIGDGGRAAGAYQIHRAYWADGTKFLGVNWDYELAADPERAREVVRTYLLHYGRGRSLLEMARIHNGGPNGHRKQSTLVYARRIARLLDDADPAE